MPHTRDQAIPLPISRFSTVLWNLPRVFGPNGTIYSTAPNILILYHPGYVLNVSPPPNIVCATISCLWKATPLYGFSGGADGNMPNYGALIFDHAGNMYGTTSEGGSGNGVVYEMMGSGLEWTEQAIYAFAAHLTEPFLLAELFSTTPAISMARRRRVVHPGTERFMNCRPRASGWAERVLYSFTGGNDGSFPTAGLIFDQSGNLYGSTNVGGTGGGGTVFELSPSGGGGWTYNLLHSFTGATNCGPWGPLTLKGAISTAPRCAMGQVAPATFGNCHPQATVGPTTRSTTSPAATMENFLTVT